MRRKLQGQSAADVCLVLEGTYPYVSGGVSTWVHQLVTSLPDLSFEIVHIGAKQTAAQTPRYDAPKNVILLRDIFLEAELPASEMRKGRASRKVRRELADAARACLIDGTLDLETALLAFLEAGDQFTFHDFWTEPDMWDVFNDLYAKRMPDLPFKDFFWTARALMRPVWNVLRACDNIGTPKVFFTACTGYAGMMATLLSQQRNVGFLLSEHGIYVRERFEEVRCATWINDQDERRPAILRDFGRLKSLWMGLFKEQASMAYKAADLITALFERNADIQKDFGAPPEKIVIIPNGVGRELLDSPPPVREIGRRPTVGFLGRIVPIKDVKTLLRSAAIVLREIPEAQFLLAEPTDEEPDYFSSCLELVRQLGIGGNVHFLGMVKPAEFLRKIDLLALCSVSEGMPFAILEGFALGVPTVSTNVGACRELIEGREGDGFGHAGIVTEVRDPSQLADALKRVLTDDGLRVRMGEAGRERVNRYYVQDDVIRRYLALFGRIHAGRNPRAEVRAEAFAGSSR